MSSDRARHAFARFCPRPPKRALLGTISAITLAGALAAATLPAAADIKAKAKIKARVKHQETEHLSKEPFGNIPKGPLQIIISIDQQMLHLYSDGTHVADTLVATGVPAHPTPMGVFSVIQRSRYHRSNIYSGAPMPYMQRITWSGVAIHEGVNLGHPASHGCIRMAHEFAARLWVLHSLGARVIIARPELRPEEFADPHLFVHKEKPRAPAPAAPAPSVSAPAAAEAVKTAQSVDRSKTIDAVVASAPSAPPGAKRTDAAPAERVTDINSAALALKPTILDPVPSQEWKDTFDTAAAGDGGDPPPAAAGMAPSEGAAASGPAQLDPVDPRSPPTALATEAPETNRPSASEPAAAAPLAAPQTVPVPIPKPAELAHAAAMAPIAIFISGTEKKIYVRQDFSPLFDAPVTIEHPEQHLGTHVFTAMEYLDDGSTFRWNVVSLPGAQPKTARNTDNETKVRDGRAAKRLPDPAPPQTPRQALARIEIPQDIIDQVSALIVPGSSLIVSDQGLGSETGEGTSFIVVTH